MTVKSDSAVRTDVNSGFDISEKTEIKRQVNVTRPLVIPTYRNTSPSSKRKWGGIFYLSYVINLRVCFTYLKIFSRNNDAFIGTRHCNVWCVHMRTTRCLCKKI